MDGRDFNYRCIYFDVNNHKILHRFITSLHAVTVHRSVHSPLYCPPVCTASSCVPCRWTWAGTTSANRSCRSDPEWRQRWSWSARPGRPPATGTCLRWEETSLQLLQAEERLIDFFFFHISAYKVKDVISFWVTSLCVCVCVCVCVRVCEVRIAWPLSLTKHHILLFESNTEHFTETHTAV